MKLSLLWNVQAALSFHNPHPRPAPAQLHCTHYMGRELGEGVGSLINERDDTGYKSHTGVQQSIPWQPKKKKKQEDQKMKP